VVLGALGTCGLGWREAGALLPLLDEPVANGSSSTDSAESGADA
jgi:hypothetical protein